VAGEEVQQDLGALGLEDPAAHVDAMVEPRIAYDVKSDATAPALGSYAPKTRVGIRASTRAPAHIVHGSRVTTSV